MKTNTCLILPLFVLFLYGCKKESNNSTVSSQVDIFMAGWESIPHVATYWKNGVVVHLTDATQTAEANAIIVSGNDVYVAGSVNNNAVYWKNGTPHILAYSNSTLFYCVANSIAVSGNDVYVAGTSSGAFSKALCWKNGIGIPLQGIGQQVSGTANSIAVYGNDVYVAGNLFYLSPGWIAAKCWKNNEPVMSIDSTRAAFVKSICVVKK
jgi:hypothetical protein